LRTSRFRFALLEMKASTSNLPKTFAQAGDTATYTKIFRSAKMQKNVGGIDRVLRIVAGIVVLSLFFVVGDEYRWWTLLGIVPLMTGLIGWCPAYLPFGASSCKMRAP
jgi:hypothetical protein